MNLAIPNYGWEVVNHSMLLAAFRSCNRFNCNIIKSMRVNHLIEGITCVPQTFV
jgi:hypothetical protein